jgi:hypothetical protein
MKAVAVVAFAILAPLVQLPLLIALLYVWGFSFGGFLLYLGAMFLLDLAIAYRFEPFSDITTGILLGVGALGLVLSVYSIFSVVGLTVIWSSLALIALGSMSAPRQPSGRRRSVPG